LSSCDVVGDNVCKTGKTMLNLSNSHKEELYNIIVEINGDNFIETFIETGFDVFEDVAGYETVEEDALQFRY